MSTHTHHHLVEGPFRSSDPLDELITYFEVNGYSVSSRQLGRLPANYVILEGADQEQESEGHPKTESAPADEEIQGDNDVVDNLADGVDAGESEVVCASSEGVDSDPSYAAPKEDPEVAHQVDVPAEKAEPIEAEPIEAEPIEAEPTEVGIERFEKPASEEAPGPVKLRPESEALVGVVLTRGERSASFWSSDMTDLLAEVRVEALDSGIKISYEVVTTGQHLTEDDLAFWRREAANAERFVCGKVDSAIDWRANESIRIEQQQRDIFFIGIKAMILTMVLVFFGYQMAC